jgi:rSAM/selenodomain-associated transferase 1
MSGGAIAVFAKAPQPGRVKTRMTPPLSPQQAAALYAALLRDVLEATARIAAELGLAPVLVVDPREQCRALARDAPRAYRVVSQRGADLAQRMDWAARELAAAGSAPILLRGSDSPILDGARVREALEALEDADLALCPDRDGGYSLIGLRRPAPGLFAHPMSTRSVLEDTLANARAAGLRCCTLGPSFDLDCIEDLGELARARELGVTALCERTLAYLDAERLWRFASTDRSARTTSESHSARPDLRPRR